MRYTIVERTRIPDDPNLYHDLYREQELVQAGLDYTAARALLLELITCNDDYRELYMSTGKELIQTYWQVLADEAANFIQDYGVQNV